MKTLILIRHAKSDWHDIACNDFDRRLNERGRADAPMMAERLARRLVDGEIELDGWLCSSALRAKETAALMAPVLGFPEQVVDFHPALYLASPQLILDDIQQLPAQMQTVAVLAHNPGITELAEKLTGEDFGNVPTCGVITISLPIDAWIDAGNWADLVDYDFPKKVCGLSG